MPGHDDRRVLDLPLLPPPSPVREAPDAKRLANANTCSAWSCRRYATKAHPRVALLVSTVGKALDDLFHFVALFLLIFVCFGIIGVSSFGQKLDDFRTFPIAIPALFDIMVGGPSDWSENALFAVLLPATLDRLRAAGVREVPDSLKCRYTSSYGSLSPTGDSRLYSNLDSRLALP